MANKNPNDKLDPRLVKISFIMLLGVIAPALDATVVNVAIKTIIAELHSTLAVAQWITTAYILAMGIAVPLSGWLVNRFSGKNVYIVSLAIFGVGSVAAALSPTMGCLIAFRTLQGAGAGVMLPVMQTVLVRSADGGKLPRLMAIIGIPAAIIPVLGPTVGGLIINSLPWQWIFIINIPICIIAFILSLIYLPAHDAVNKRQPLDIIGLLLLSPAFCVIIFGISALRSPAAGDMRRGILLLATGIILLIAYCAYVLRSKKEPPMDIRLFRRTNFSASVILIFLYGMFSTGTLFVLPLFFQQAYQTTAFTAGLLLAPQGIGMLCTRSLAAKGTGRYGSRPIIFAGLILSLLGSVPLAIVHSGGLLAPIIILLVRGAGLGAAVVPAMTSIYEGLGKNDISQGTTTMRIFQQIGGAFGTALLAIILAHGLAKSGGAHVFFAFNQVFWWSCALTLAALVPVFFLAKKKPAEEHGGAMA